MRDLAIFAIVFVGAIAALRRPWIGILLWTWLSVMNPHRYTWGLAHDFPLAAVAAVCTLLGLLTYREKESPFKGAPAAILLVLMAWMTLSWLLGMDPQGDFQQWSMVMKIDFMILVALAAMRSKNHILALTWVLVASLALLGIKGGLFTLLSGGSHRVWGPEGSFIEDNNAFALSLVMIIPLLYFLQLQAADWRIRLGLRVAMLLCAASALGSHSRGALLAIAAMGAMFWWRSRRKGVAGILIAIVVLALLPMMPEEWWGRMHTIGTYEQDASAQGRFHAWHVAWEVARHNFLGAGMGYQHQLLFSLYGVNDNRVFAAHSIYFQMLGNHGFVGLFLFLALWLATFRSAGWLRRQGADRPESRWAADLGAMIQVGLVGYAVGGAFLSLAYFDLPYDMMALVVLARKWVETRAWEREPQGVGVLESLGLRRRRRVPPPSAVLAHRVGVAQGERHAA